MLLGEIFEEITAAQTALDSTGIVLTVRAASPLEIVRFGVNISVDSTDTFSMELERRTHNNAGTLAAAVAVGGRSVDSLVSRTAGNVLFADVGIGSDDTTLGDADNRVIIKPGDLVQLNITDAFTAGDGFPFIQFQKLNFDKVGFNAQFSEEDGTLRIINGATPL